jgi:hypothetical protein
MLSSYLIHCMERPYCSLRVWVILRQFVYSFLRTLLWIWPSALPFDWRVAQVTITSSDIHVHQDEALRLAVEYNHPSRGYASVVHLLLEKEGSLFSSDQLTESLHQCVIHGHAEVFHLLLRAGADPYELDFDVLEELYYERKRFRLTRIVLRAMLSIDCNRLIIA